MVGRPTGVVVRRRDDAHVVNERNSRIAENSDVLGSGARHITPIKVPGDSIGVRLAAIVHQRPAAGKIKTGGAGGGRGGFGSVIRKDPESSNSPVM